MTMFARTLVVLAGSAVAFGVAAPVASACESAPVDLGPVVDDTTVNAPVTADVLGDVALADVLDVLN